MKNIFLEFTYKNTGKKVLVNKLNITKIKSSDSGLGTYIYFTNSQTSEIKVAEDYDQVKNTLQKD